MKRAVLAIFCWALLAGAPGAKADPASDQDIASRYLRAAQSGDDESQFYVGALCSAGIGMPRSDAEAFRWFARAADQGHSHAMLILSGLYAVGRGVTKDNIKAYEWAYIVGSASRVEEFRNGSRQLMGVLETRMSPDEIKRAKTEAGQWRPVVISRPAQSAMSPDASRSAPPQVSAASPAPPSAAPGAPPATKTTSNEPSNAPDTLGNVSKGGVDGLLKEVPSGLRKKFGF
ncbi:MAG: sel1 repeat family protein [Bradyrhizobium sp.]|nr:sel1 repeat family protein [Bradyrhizobium sp.]